MIKKETCKPDAMQDEGAVARLEKFAFMTKNTTRFENVGLVARDHET